MLKVVRSPAKVTWFVQYNGVTVDVKQTRKAALISCERYRDMLRVW